MQNKEIEKILETIKVSLIANEDKIDTIEKYIIELEIKVETMRTAISVLNDKFGKWEK